MTGETTAQLKRGKAYPPRAGPGHSFLREKRRARELLKTRLLFLPGMAWRPGWDANPAGDRLGRRPPPPRVSPSDPEIAHEHFFFSVSKLVRERRLNVQKLCHRVQAAKTAGIAGFRRPAAPPSYYCYYYFFPLLREKKEACIN